MTGEIYTKEKLRKEIEGKGLSRAVAKMKKRENKLVGVDLFSGCGGLSYGFLKAGFDIVAGIDSDPDACETYFHNLGDDVSYVLVWDLFERTPEDFFNETIAEPEDLDVVIGGPPCRGFSIAGNRDESDERNNLIEVFLDWVDFISPKAVLMENVPGIKDMYGGKAAKRVEKRLGENFNEGMKVFNAARYGVPQTRRRAIFIGTRRGEPPFPRPDHGLNGQTRLGGETLEPAATVGEAIGDLPSLVAGGKSEIPNHEARNHGEEQVKKMSYVGRGENWESLPEKYIEGKNYPSHGYYRLDDSEPSRVLPANASSTSMLHPCDDRQITAREFARLQSFPDWFVFRGRKGTWHRQIGDAVPPLLAEKLARSLKKTLLEGK